MSHLDELNESNVYEKVNGGQIISDEVAEIAEQNIKKNRDNSAAEKYGGALVRAEYYAVVSHMDKRKTKEMDNAAKAKKDAMNSGLAALKAKEIGADEYYKIYNEADEAYDKAIQQASNDYNKAKDKAYKDIVRTSGFW